MAFEPLEDRALLAGGTYSIIEPPDSSGGATVTGVSGKNIVGYYHNGLRSRGFVFDGATYTPIDFPGSSSTLVYGVSGDSVVGVFTGSSGRETGFLYTGTTYVEVHPPGAAVSDVRGISNGLVAGVYSDFRNNLHGFVFDGSSYTLLDPPGRHDAVATAVSGSRVAGNRFDGSISLGFVFEGGVYTTFQGPDGSSIRPLGISGDNVVGAYFSGGKQHAFLYDGATVQTLEPSGSNWISSTANAIDGKHVAGAAQTENAAYSRAFYYDGSDYTLLSPPGAVESFATGVSDEVVVGAYRDRSFIPRGFVYYLPSLRTDIIAQKIEITSTDANYSWSIEGPALTADPTLKLYWSDNSTFEPGVDSEAYAVDTVGKRTANRYVGSAPLSALRGTPKVNLLLVVDPNNAVHECDEPTAAAFGTNNVSALWLADIVGVSVRLKDLRTLEYTYDSTFASEPFSVRLYVSSDPVWDASDQRFSGNHEFSFYPVNNHVSRSELHLGASLVLPAATPYLIVRADADGAFFETDESNNDVVLGFKPDSPWVDWVVPSSNVDSQGRIPGNEHRQIVMHATAGVEAAALDRLTSTADPDAPSAHYLVNREGKVYQLVPDRLVANHAGSGEGITTNRSSFGIELVDSNGIDGNHLTNPGWLDARILSKAALLVRELTEDYGIPQSHLTTSAAWCFETQVDPRPGFPTGASEHRIPADIPGIIGHWQVLDGPVRETNPDHFPWDRFMAAVTGGFCVHLDGPANLLLTDPFGRRIGFDPVTQQTVVEIPGAGLTAKGPASRALWISLPQSGQYTLTVHGTGVGVYTLDIVAADMRGAIADYEIISTTAQGANANHRFINVIDNPTRTRLLSQLPADERLVSSLYVELLGRTPEARGFDYWVGLMRSGHTPDQIIAGVQSNYESWRRIVQQLFQSHLRRRAEADAADYFAGILSSGGTKEEVAARIMASDEYFLQQGGGAHDGFLSAAYASVLRRAPSAAERESHRRNGRREIARELLALPEFIERVVGEAYLAYLDRGVDIEGLRHWSSVVRTRGESAAIFELINSAEYRSRL